jgi:hypothetical protein
MKTKFEDLQFLVKHIAPKITLGHHTGTDEMGPYEYWSYQDPLGGSFSSPNWNYFVSDVIWNLCSEIQLQNGGTYGI